MFIVGEGLWRCHDRGRAVRNEKRICMNHLIFHQVHPKPEHRVVYEEGYGILLICLIYESNLAQDELGLNDAHRHFLDLCPTFGSFRSFVTRLEAKGIIKLNTSRQKKNKKILIQGPKFPLEIFLSQKKSALRFDNH